MSREIALFGLRCGRARLLTLLRDRTQHLARSIEFAQNFVWSGSCRDVGGGSMQARRILFPVAAAASLGSLAAIYRAYRRDMRKAQQRVSRGSSIIHTKRGNIEYAAIGEGAPLLVVHGAGGGFDQALDFAPKLNQAGFRCIFVSRFGYLRTPLPADASPEAQADLYASLLDSLAIPEAAILGVSAGAPSALQFAIRYPERCSALVLLVPATFAPDGARL